MKSQILNPKSFIMKLIVGLGNPGQRYKNTRHNMGFLAIDHLVDRWKPTGPNKRSHGKIYHASLFDEKIILVKPETFMNLSGSCVGPLFEFYKVTAEDLVVIHDDIDLQFLALRIKTGGGTGGHKGLKSIDEHIGYENSGYHRVRIGIGRPEDSRIQEVEPQEVEPQEVGPQPADWVLQKFSDDEFAKIDELLDMVADSVELVVKGRVSEAMNRYNRRKAQNNPPYF